MGKLKVHEINLEHYFLPVIDVAANPEHKPGDETLTIFSVNTQISEVNDTKRLAVNIEVKSDQDESTNPPYNFRLLGVGFLSISAEEYDSENAKEACLQVGHQVLFGAIREQIASLTGRGPWDAIQLRVVPAPTYTPNDQPQEASGKSEQPDQQKPKAKKAG
jgi:preprotein translocase subunit SecB